MGLSQEIINDIYDVTTDLDGWGVEMTFIAKTGEIAEVVGVHTKHHLGYDSDGNKVNTKNASVSISERALVEKLYPVRDASEEVNLEGHKVLTKDSTGRLCTYMIRQWLPDEKMGLIVCILSDYQL